MSEEREIITRADAKARGLKKYFTGKPCKHGHVCERLTSISTCEKCNIIASELYRSSNPDYMKKRNEKINLLNKRKYANDPEFRAAKNARALGAWRRKCAISYGLDENNGLSDAEIEAMLAEPEEV